MSGHNFSQKNLIFKLEVQIVLNGTETKISSKKITLEVRIAIHTAIFCHCFQFPDVKPRRK